MLLLSVLPPVIPRASWPLADHMHNNPMRRSVTFSSQPHIEGSISGTRLPAIDLFNLRLRHQQNFERKGFLDRIRRVFGSHAPSRKQSTASIGPSGIAAALKSHMGLLTGLLPTTGSSSCHTLNTPHVDSKSFRRTSLFKSGTALNTIHIEIVDTELIQSRNRRMSTAFNISSHLSNPIAETNGHYVEIESETKVNFQLPANRRPSIVHQLSQPTLRERVKGSPRFPHRIVPTSSLNALEEDGGLDVGLLNVVAGKLVCSPPF
jgi:gamma-aminobutyric acid type B receptor